MNNRILRHSLVNHQEQIDFLLEPWQQGYVKILWLNRVTPSQLVDVETARRYYVDLKVNGGYKVK